MELVKTTKLQRNLFFKEVDGLKTKKFEGFKEEEILLSPS